MQKRLKYVFPSMQEYFRYNKEEIRKQRNKYESQKNSISFSVSLKYHRYYRKYFIIIPKIYLENLNYLRQNKSDIFTKGKILRLTSINRYNKNLSFDAVVNGIKINKYNKGVVFAYLIPIKRYYRNSKYLLCNYIIKERNGDLTYERMDDALNGFFQGKNCSNNIQKYILGFNPQQINSYASLNALFNYRKIYPNNIPNYYTLNLSERRQINRLFLKEMNTVLINPDNKFNLICFIIYAVYYMRMNNNDKILICSSSNKAADSIALQLLKMNEYLKQLKILRIYAKNQEIVKRNKLLSGISYHKLLMKEKNRNNYKSGRNLLIENSDIIISTCVNSYCDEMINYEFPFVIIVDANNSNENENLIPITLLAKHVTLIGYQKSDSGNLNLYKRMKDIYPENHIEF